MNILEARRRLLDGEIKKRTAEGENISVRSVSRMRPALTLYGKSEQRTTTGAQLFDANQIMDGFVNGLNVGESFTVSTDPTYPNAQYVKVKTTDINIIAWNLTGCVKTGAWESAGESGIRIRYFDAEGVSVKVGGTVPKTGSSETQNADSVYVLAIYGFTEEAKSKAIVNTGITALPWEPYTGGQPSPNPDYPQEIKSVGDSGTVNVTLSDGGSQSQTLPVQTPNGLPGIPVSSDGNYTDADGQQWVCDEVDFKRGVYVQRVKEISDIAWKLRTGYTVDGSELFFATNIIDGLQLASNQNSAYCSKLIRGNRVLNQNISGFYQSYGSVFARIKDVGDLDAFEELMQGAVILYQLEIPVETPLSPSALAAYAALRTYSPTTVVSNNAGAWMKLTYKTRKSLEVNA